VGNTVSDAGRHAPEDPAVENVCAPAPENEDNPLSVEDGPMRELPDRRPLPTYVRLAGNGTYIRDGTAHSAQSGGVEGYKAARPFARI
jgi:hypothetical protein